MSRMQILGYIIFDRYFHSKIHFVVQQAFKKKKNEMYKLLAQCLYQYNVTNI